MRRKQAFNFHRRKVEASVGENAKLSLSRRRSSEKEKGASSRVHTRRSFRGQEFEVMVDGIAAAAARKGADRSKRHGATFTKRERNSSFAHSLFLCCSGPSHTPRPRSEVSSGLAIRARTSQPEGQRNRHTESPASLFPAKRDRCDCENQPARTSSLLRRSTMPSRSILLSHSLTLSLPLFLSSYPFGDFKFTETAMECEHVCRRFWKRARLQLENRRRN